MTTSINSDESIDRLIDDNEEGNDDQIMSSENYRGRLTAQIVDNIGDTSLNNQHNFQNYERGTTFPQGGGGACHGISNGYVDDDIHPPNRTDHETSHKKYSTTRVSTVLSCTALLSAIVYTSDQLIAQYLLDRWSYESGHSKSGPDRGPCDRNESDPWVIQNDRVQARVSMSVMHYSFATSFPALLSSLVFGALVDMVGRKPALISSLLGFTCKISLVMCIIKFNLDPNFFYLAYACDGIGGGLYVNLIASFSITADISKRKSRRILGIACLTVIGQIMYAVANIVIGLLIKSKGYVIASSVILAPVALALFINILFLPETLPMQKQKVSFAKLWNYTTRVIYLYSRDGDRRKRLSLIFSLLIFFTSMINTANLGTNDALYQRHEPLCWDSEKIGYYSACRNLGAYAALVYLWICRCFACVSDEFLSMIGMLFVAGSFVLEAFVRNPLEMYMVSILMIPGLNLTPITRGVMSVLAGPDKQGVMFSSIALIEVMCSLVANIVYNKIYAVTVGFMPGFVYLVMAGMSLVTVFLYIPFFYFYDGCSSSYETLSDTQDNSDDSSTDSSRS